MYRLAISLARVWSPSRHHYHNFGVPAVRILATLDIIPLRIFALLFCIGHNGKTALQGIIQQGENWLLPGPPAGYWQLPAINSPCLLVARQSMATVKWNVPPDWEGKLHRPLFI